MGSREHSFLSPTSGLHEQHSARELAEESKSALVDLEIILKRRTETLEQQIQDKHRETKTLSREKEDIEHKLQDERLAYASKREQLWNELEQGEEALECKNQVVLRLEERLGVQAREFAEEERRLQRQLQDLHMIVAQTANELDEKNAKATTRQEQLQQEVERLQEQLEEQSAAFEQERSLWTQQGTAAGGREMRELKSLLLRAMPHLRSLLDACDRELGNKDAGSNQVQAQESSLAGATVDLTQAGNETPSPREQDFNEGRAQLLEQASDAARTKYDVSLSNLTQREGVLTCPISLELFANPVVTSCCGKTFSSDGLRQALRKNSLCPICRASSVSFCPNRDVATLVELHRAERSVLGLPKLSAPSNAEAEEQEPRTADAYLFCPIQSPPSTRQVRHRDNRSERVHARSGVSHRQPARTASVESYRQGQPPTPLMSTAVSAASVNTPGTVSTRSRQEFERSQTRGSGDPRLISPPQRRGLSFFFHPGTVEGGQQPTEGSLQGIRQPTSRRRIIRAGTSTPSTASTRNHQEIEQTETRGSNDPRLISRSHRRVLRLSFFLRSGTVEGGQHPRTGLQQGVDGRSDDTAHAQLTPQIGSASSLSSSYPAVGQEWPSNTGRRIDTDCLHARLELELVKLRFKPHRRRPVLKTAIYHANRVEDVHRWHERCVSRTCSISNISATNPQHS